MSTLDWRKYLDAYHDDRPGITEQILSSATSPHHGTPYSWLAEPLQQATAPILDLACGSAPTRALLVRSRWLGLDASAGELAAAAAAGRGPLVRATADALPLADDTVDAVCAAMCLQVLTPLDAVLAELRRVLRPGGMIVALVPSQLPRSELWRHPSGVIGWVRVLRALGIRSEPWPNPQARDGLAGLLQVHGFVVDSDERCLFRRTVADLTDAALMVHGLYLPGVHPESIDRAKRALTSWARPRRSLPPPLRRVVAHLPHRDAERPDRRNAAAAVQ